MDPQDKPKRRLVTYVTEEVYDQLLSESKTVSRSISSIAEMKILQGMGTGTDQHEPAHASDEKIKSSVIETISNLPDESLQILADRLSKILDRHGPARGDTPGISQEDSDLKPLDKKSVQDMAARICEFMERQGLTQRSFKSHYGMDISHLKSWKTGSKLMCLDTYQRFEKILSPISQ